MTALMPTARNPIEVLDALLAYHDTIGMMAAQLRVQKEQARRAVLDLHHEPQGTTIFAAAAFGSVAIGSAQDAKQPTLSLEEESGYNI